MEEGEGRGLIREHLLSRDQKKGVLGQQAKAFHILQLVNSKVAPHSGVFRGARISSLPTKKLP